MVKLTTEHSISISVYRRNRFKRNKKLDYPFSYLITTSNLFFLCHFEAIKHYISRGLVTTTDHVSFIYSYSPISNSILRENES
ncbi:MAG: hypothetical protein ACW99A_03585 [Candidatus Kariarchaeaceae archaeon]|jgi:hypothetical protein